MNVPVSKMDICRAVFREIAEHFDIASMNRKDIIKQFVASAGCSEAAASTYYNTIRNEFTGRMPEKRDVDYSNDPDVEDERELFTVVTPRDSDDRKSVVVAETHSFYSLQAAKKMIRFDQFVVSGLPEIGQNIDDLVPLN